jgi:hypothetical protein
LSIKRLETFRKTSNLFPIQVAIVRRGFAVVRWTATGEIVPGARPSAASPEAGYVLPVNTDLSGLPAPLRLNRGKAYSLPELIDIAQSNNPQTRTA